MPNSIQRSALAIAGILLVAGCSNLQATSQPPSSPAAETGGTYRTLTIDALADILANRHDQYTIINVHIPYEGEIEGTNTKIPYNDLSALMAALPDKNAPIILYCRSGRMSEIASHALLDKGYTQVWDVPGGMIAWQATGRSLIDK
jgi:rhodanese-related sulfurtransferase